MFSVSLYKSLKAKNHHRTTFGNYLFKLSLNHHCIFQGIYFILPINPRTQHSQWADKFPEVLISSKMYMAQKKHDLGDEADPRPNFSSVLCYLGKLICLCAYWQELSVTRASYLFLLLLLLRNGNIVFSQEKLNQPCFPIRLSED